MGSVSMGSRYFVPGGYLYRQFHDVFASTPLKYGYHVAALNQIQAVLTCKSIQKAYVPSNDLSTCIHMSDATFSFVTSIFTIGGLLGSLGSKLVNDSWGRKGAARTGALSIAFGAGLMGLSHSVAPFAIGRQVSSILYGC